MEKITSLFEESKFFIKRFWRQVSGMSLPIIKSCLTLLSSVKEHCCEILLLRWQSVFLKITYFHAQKQPPEVFLFERLFERGVLVLVRKVFLEILQNSHKNTCARVFFLLKFIRPQACNFIKKETLTQVFSCEFCEIFKKSLFTEHLQATASTCPRSRMGGKFKRCQ